MHSRKTSEVDAPTYISSTASSGSPLPKAAKCLEMIRGKHRVPILFISFLHI